MATFNGASFLKPQLDSIVRQSLRPDELVICDDNSSDSSVALVRQFASEAPFNVSVHQNKTRLHYGENFLRTAARCTGDFIAFCDQDDVWLPEKLETCVNALQSTGAMLCAHDAYVVDRELKPLRYFAHRPAPGLHPPLTLDPWGAFFGFTIVFRRELLSLIPAVERPDDNIEFSRKLAHDRWVYFLSTTFGSTLYIDQPLALYRQHGGNTFGACRRARFSELHERLQKATPDLQKHADICLQRSRLLRRCSLSNDLHTSIAAGRAATYWERLEAIYRLRLSSASDPSFARRIAACLRLVSLDAYAPFARGGLSGKALMKDLALALLPSTPTMSMDA